MIYFLDIRHFENPGLKMIVNHDAMKGEHHFHSGHDDEHATFHKDVMEQITS